MILTLKRRNITPPPYDVSRKASGIVGGGESWTLGPVPLGKPEALLPNFIKVEPVLSPSRIFFPSFCRRRTNFPFFH